MTPDFTVQADTQNITDTIKRHLISLRITDEAGWQSDSLEIRLDDPKSAMALPRHGAELLVSLGYIKEGTVRMGTFTVDEVSVEGPPETLIIRARAANFRNSLKEQKTRAWEGVTLGDLVSTIASEHGLSPVISEALAAKVLIHIDQVDESDLHFLTRLSKDMGAISKPAENRLLFVTRGEARTASSKPMPEIPLHRSELTRYQFSLADRGKYAAVIAHWHNSETGQSTPVKVGETDTKPVFTLKGLHPDASAAESAATAKLQALRRGQATGSLTVPGRADLMAETLLQISGIKPTIDGDWIITRAEHELGSQGYITRLSVESPTK
ncbi:contractile injection system protein, VgrG/Pvc8 family [Candidatus Sororendozoicomonas aggregata]|uniref:contractile injection system protein, VgrG/Pvc8 family n=1 Tax=Candidatus Sororendozoicomonas aggregata TaxID=3073239 RepID=UPI002ED6095A